MTTGANATALRTVAVGKTRESAATVFGRFLEDFFVTSLSDFDVEVDLTSLDMVAVVLEDGVQDVLPKILDQQAALEPDALVVQVAVVGDTEGSDLLQTVLDSRPAVGVVKVTPRAEGVVLQLSRSDSPGAMSGESTRALLAALDVAAQTPLNGSGGGKATPVERAPRPSEVAAGPAGAGNLRRVAARVRGAGLRVLASLAMVGVVLLAAVIAVAGATAGTSGVIIVLLITVILGELLLVFAVTVVYRQFGPLQHGQRVQTRIHRRMRKMLNNRTHRILAQQRTTPVRRQDIDFLRKYGETLGAELSRARAQSNEQQGVLARQLLDTQRQVQANLNIQQLVELEAGVPPMSGWVASPDLILLAMDEMLHLKPRTVVECGSGVSTLFLALTASQHQLPTRIIALEHHPRFKRSTEELLARHGVAEHVDVRLAPLVPSSVPGHDTPWYDESALSGLGDIGILFVDGPPTATGELARYPAIPLLRDALAADCTIIVDDLVRESDRTVVKLWQEMLPDFDYEVLTTLQKHVGLFRRGQPRA
ncbi:MAG: hypothetical protein JWR85_2047 [Marmoricola sp.]|nr:hypothetical protein [Marmoricola sp.]